MKKHLLTIMFIGLMAHLSWACSCEGPVLTFCELLDKESELLMVEVETITAPTDSTNASMTVTILDIINGHTFDSLTNLTIFGSQNGGADCLATLSNFSINEQLMISPIFLDNQYTLYDACGQNFTSLKAVNSEYAIYRDSIIACSGITNIERIDKPISTVISYPNPVTHTLNYTSNIKIKKVQLFDTSGQLILTETPNTFNSFIALTALKTGIYIAYFIKEDHQIEIKKVIKI